MRNQKSIYRLSEYCSGDIVGFVLLFQYRYTEKTNYSVHFQLIILYELRFKSFKQRIQPKLNPLFCWIVSKTKIQLICFAMIWFFCIFAVEYELSLWFYDTISTNI